MLFNIVIFTSFVLNTLCDNIDGGKAPRILLNDGNTMPVLGLGTFLGFDEKGLKNVKDGEVESLIRWGLEAGYRMFDTAALYKNEEQIGKAVRNSDVKREDIFIVNKLANDEHRKVVPALRRSLERLNITYVDLYLIHFPMAFKANMEEFDERDYLETWKDMVEAKKLGLAKSIGVSNFNVSQITRLLNYCVTKPAVLQVEVSLNLAQENLIQFAKNNEIMVMAYAPFGSLFKRSPTPPPPRANDPCLVALAKKHGKTVPQIVLRYLLQRGVMPIPKSTHKERIEENIDLFDFELTSEDMDNLSEFNKNYRTVLPSFWQDHLYYPFEKIDKPEPNLFKEGLKEDY